MTLPKKLTSIRLIAVFSCLLALGSYSAFLPPPASAGGGGDVQPVELPEEIEGYCYYAGQQYSLGAELNGKTCKVHNGEYYWG